MNSTIIVTAADSKFFELVQGTILSIREKPQGHSVDIGFLDVGCTPEQLQWIGQYVDHIVEPDWNYDIPDIDRQPKYLKALVCRPFLPEYFPGYEVYIWIDADAWVQDWSAIELLTLGARYKNLAVVPELLNTLFDPYPFSHQAFNLSGYIKYFGDVYNHLYIRPVLNDGVFSGSNSGIHWVAWKNRLSQAISMSIDLSFSDQCSLNLAIYNDLGIDNVQILPLFCNWTVHSKLPLWDPKRKLWVEPWKPYIPLGILHITTRKAKDRKTHVAHTTDGFKVEASLWYPRSHSSPIRRYDYVSANQKKIYLDYNFPLMTAIDPGPHPWPYLRKEVPHLWTADLRQPTIDFVSRDEAHILYNTALKLQGKNALEIGCWLGWSTAHLAAGGVIL
ncbi:macrocin O-methyltransferase, partial [Synechococcus sp. R60.3]